MRLPYNNHAEMRTSKISGNQVPEHRSTTRKSVAKQTAATMKRQHCTPAPRPREFKVHHIDGAGLQSPFIGAENRTVPFIGRDCHHQQCSIPGTPRGKEQENRPPPPQQRTGYPLHNSPAASLIPKPGNHLTVKPTPSNNCCRTNRNMRAGMGPDNM